MRTGKNGMLAVITLIGVMALAGNAQAAVTAQGGVNSTAADREITTLWLDVNPSDYVTAKVFDGGAVIDYFYYSDLSPLLDRNGYSSGDTNIPVTVAMFCSGTERDIDGVPHCPYTNDYRNATVVHFTADYADGFYYPSSYMELESCVDEESFSKFLYAGWNLISLPLTPSDNSTSIVLSEASCDAVYKYNATSKKYESADSMDPGTGYFVNATADCEWECSGTAYTSMDNIGLEQGLNMVGWLNCSKDVSDALSSISDKYHYAARWNASAQKFEVYNPAAPDSSAFNDFTTMDRGVGYFIAAKQGCILYESC
jgi:hypothetical protein